MLWQVTGNARYGKQKRYYSVWQLQLCRRYIIIQMKIISNCLLFTGNVITKFWQEHVIHLHFVIRTIRSKISGPAKRITCNLKNNRRPIRKCQPNRNLRFTSENRENISLYFVAKYDPELMEYLLKNLILHKRNFHFDIIFHELFSDYYRNALGTDNSGTFQEWRSPRKRLCVLTQHTGAVWFTVDQHKINVNLKEIFVTAHYQIHFHSADLF